MRNSLRNAARHAALDALSALQRLSGREEALARPRVHILYLHAVTEREEDAFRRLLDALARSHRFVPYSEAVARAKAGPLDRPLAAISFDDGLKSCLRAARLLEERGATGCFFVCPTIVGERRADRVAAFCRERLKTPPDEFLSWEDLEDLKRRGHEIGSHTLTHADVSTLDDASLAEELESSKAALDARLGRTRHFAWPFGRFSNARRGLAAAAERAGYDSCASAERGCHAEPAGPQAPLCLRRDHVVAGWPLRHSLYFIARSARRSSSAANAWPKELLA